MTTSSLEEWINKQKKFILEQGRQAMEARTESLLENAFRGEAMSTEVERTTVPLKDFKIITKTLSCCKERASELSTRSRKLVSLYTGESEPEKDEEEKLKVDSVVLVHVLRDIENEISRSLSEISDNLEKLENAW
ncbi:hypothetical protein LCGC14_2531430 [marine sediment metagenome]|uniref:Uncharacterized protein n=1 Tax=marine sediment metagenome TaxID=412755 RepID=A0A0F9BGA4_9ZZZZ